MMLFNIRKAVLAIFCLALTTSAIAQIETLALQDFDSGTPNWNYSSDVAFFGSWGSGFFGTIDKASTSPTFDTIPSLSGNLLGENDLDSDGGTSDFANITFEDVNLNGSQNVTLSFDYAIIGYNSSFDNVEYQLFYDGIAQTEVLLHEGGIDPLNASGNILINIPDSVNSLGFVLSIENNGGEAYSGFDNFKVEGTEPNSIVSAFNSFFTAPESNSSYGIPLNVVAPDDANSIDVNISYVSGNTDLIDNFVNTTVTIPAGASSGVFDMPRSEDGVCTGTEEVVFEITSVSGGNSAQIGTPSTFTVSFTDDQTTYSTLASDNFESGTLSGWSHTDSWEIDTTDPTSGNNSAQHLEPDGPEGHKYITKSVGSLDLSSSKTVWQANVDYNNNNPSGSNWFYFALTASNSNMYSPNQGYAVGINFDSTDDNLRLVRYDNGVHNGVSGYTDPVDVATTSYTWNAAGIVGIRVVRDDAGNWEVFAQEDGGFNNMVSVGSGTDNTYTEGTHIAFGIDVTNGSFGDFQFDDVLVTQESCTAFYYTVASGNSDEAIWSTDENAGPGEGFVVSYTSNNRLTVQDGHTLTLTGEVKALDFNVDPTATVELNGNELSVYADMFATGSFDGTTGTLSFKGNGNQTIITGGSPIRVENLKLQNNGGTSQVTISPESEIEVTGLFMPVSGTLVTGSDPARLVLISDASGTAAVDVFNPAAEVQGSIRAQRYLPASNTGWINLGAMLNNVAVADWDDDIITTGYPDSDYPDYNFFSIQGYNETIDAGINGRFEEITTNTTNLPATSGYFVYMLGGSQTIEVEGEIARGNIEKTVTFSGYSGLLEDGWNLVANPYPSAIDFDLLATPEINTMYIYSAQQGNYVSYNESTGAGEASNIIPAGQAFYVKLQSGTANLNFAENQKVGPNAEFQRSDEDMKPTVQLKIAGDGEIADYTHITLDDAATFNFDSVDGLHLGSMNADAPGISTISQEEEYKLSFNSVPTDEGAIAIPVHLDIPVAGSYSLEVSDLINFPSSSCLSIEDLETGEVTPIELGESFAIETEEAIDEARFMIHITSLSSEKSDATCFDGADGSAVVQGTGDGPWTYTWYNEMGAVVAQEENISTASEVDGLAFGTYFVEVEDESSICGTLTKTIEIDEPMQEELNVAPYSASCNESNGELVAIVENATSFDYSVTSDSGDEINGTHDADTLVFTDLPGDVYTVNISTACNTFDQMTVDLTDENAVTAEIEMENEVVEMQNGVAEVQFAHNSENATSVVWNFGNGETSELNNPIHTFTEVGEYEISLTAQNEFCDNTDTRTITVEENVSVDENNDPKEEITMTTLRERVQLDFGNARMVQPIVEVYNTAGQLVISKKLSNVNGDVILIETASLRQGIYTLTILDNETRVFSERFVR